MFVHLVLLICCSSFEQKKSSLYDELTVRDADAIMQMDYGANIVGWYMMILIFSM